MCFENRDVAYAEVCQERDTLKKKLAAYENTGVTPEEIVHIKNGIERVWKLMQDIDEEKLKHIEELVDAENEGRMQILPCRLGQEVFWKHNGVITECRVHRVSQNRTGLFLHLRSKVSHGAFRVETCMGKTVFLTREEAEAAVAADKNDGCKKVNDLYDEEGGEILSE